MVSLINGNNYLISLKYRFTKFLLFFRFDDGRWKSAIRFILSSLFGEDVEDLRVKLMATTPFLYDNTFAEQKVNHRLVQS